MTETIAYAALQIIPSLQGVQGAIDGQLAGPLVSSGRSAGRAAGRAVASGLEAARAEVARASQALAAARDKEADAAGKIRVAEAKLEELRAKGNASASQLARAEEALATAQRNGARASQARQRAVQDLSDARVRLANTTDDATDAEGRFSNALSNLRDRLGGTTKEMLAASGAAAGIGAAMMAASTAVETESLNDKLAAQLGASPQMAQEFGQIAGNLYSQAYGDSLGQVNDALKNVWQQGLVAEDAATAEIESVTASVLDLSTAFDEDVSAAAAAVGTLLKTGLAPDARSAMDTITRGFQEGANKGGDLLDTFIEYPALFQALGLSATEATGLLAQGLDAGAFNADKVADALKEFQIRATDGSETSKAAYEALGLSAEEMTAKIAGGGAGAREGLDTVLDRLRAMEDPVARNAAAVGIFGTQAEDLAGALFALDPSDAVASLGNVEGAATKLGETLNDNTATSVEELKRSIQTGLGEAFTSAAGWIQENKTLAIGFAAVLGTVATAIGVVKVATIAWNAAQQIASAATKAWTAIQWLWNAAMSANPLGIVIIAVTALVAAVVLAWKNSETFRNIVTGAWDAIKTAVSFVWESVLKPIFGFIGDGFSKIGGAATWLYENAIKPAWEAIKNGISAAWDFISGKFDDFKAGLGLIGDKAGEVKDWIVDRFNEIVGFVTGLPGKIRDAATGLWDGITDGFKSAINWLISAWNNFRLGFDFTIPVVNKHISFTIDTPDLPLLAGGGVAGRTRAGLLYGPGTGTSDSILGVGADGIPTARVSAGEGVVMERAMANGGAELVAALNDGWVPPLDLLRAMVPGLAGGGVAGSMTPIQSGMWEAIRNAFPEAQLTSATRTVDVGSGYDFHMQGKAIDIAGPNMGAMAEWIASNYPGSLELIHGNGFGRNIDNGRDVGDGMAFFGADTMAGHNDHIHWAMDSAPSIGNVEQGSGLTGGVGGGSGAGASSPGGSGGTSGGGSTGGSGTGTRPEGVATPVWVDNWPTNFGTSTSTSSTSSVGGTGAAAGYTEPTANSTNSATTSTTPAESAPAEHPLKGMPLTGELFNGDAPWYMADKPWETLQARAAEQWKTTTEGFQGFLQENWKEMLQTGAAVVGMGAGAGGGGNTYNLIGPDPRQAAMAVERVHRREAMASMRRGGFGR
ncbi:phage tail tape measure protein [Nocardia cyriacigeorgica]|uniref:phage tail tape measure protein n=2 Tax=Nocardia TaxID=1817 RepID=UPI0018934339|nr:phage tail tape measure protein [Nocardia cyriacigeorgica]MBF6326765.1 phage tail tape measure protein [Nocardia cyriacigeorgica]